MILFSLSSQHIFNLESSPVIWNPGIPRVQQDDQQDRDLHLHQHGGAGGGRGEVPQRAEGEVQPLHHRGPDQPDETVKGESG